MTLTLIVDSSIPVYIRFSYHLVHLVICHFIAQVRHDLSQLGAFDETVAVFIEYLKGIGWSNEENVNLCSKCSCDRFCGIQLRKQKKSVNDYDIEKDDHKEGKGSSLVDICELTCYCNPWLW